MKHLADLLHDVDVARRLYLESTRELSPEQGALQPGPNAWSAAQVTEHLYLAEMAGVNGMWKALDGIRRGEPVWPGEQVHRGLSIEEVTEKTWPEQVDAPAIASPSWGGPLAFWTQSLGACDATLKALARELKGAELTEIVYPHPISGPLNVVQRLEFLRFHLDHHREQIGRIRQSLARV